MAKRKKNNGSNNSAGRDITEREQAEEAVRESDYWKQAIIDSIPSVAWLKDKEYRFVAVNERLCEALGMRAEDLIGKTDFDVWPRDLAEQFRADDEEVMKTGKPKRVEGQWVLAGGDRIWIETIKTPIFDEKGEVIATSGIAHDITERKRAEEALRKSEKQASAAIEAARGITFNYDIATGKIEWGGTIKEIIEYTPKEFVQVDVDGWAEMIHPDDKDRVLSILQGAIQKKDRAIAEYRFRTKKGGYVILSSISLTEKKDGKAVRLVGILQDITERKRAEETLKRFNRMLIEKSKELESIIQIASHDLRTPLVTARGFGAELAKSCEQVQSILKKKHVPEKIKKELSSVVAEDIPESLGIIQHSVEKIDSLLSALLRLARLGKAATKFEMLDMDAMLRDIKRSMAYQIQDAGARVEIGRLPKCVGDKVQINQVFSNLLDNAVKYLDGARPGVIQISGWSEPDRIVYCVEDNGVGIEADNQEDVFDIFYQLRPDNGSGEGLGLAIVRRIMDRHDGKVWVDSEVGRGSKFFVSLPTKQ